MKWKKEYFEFLNHQRIADIELDRAISLKLKNLPEFLYRYRPPSDNAIKSLESGITYLSSPLDFNDPYDCSFSVSITSMVLKDFNENLPHLIEQSGGQIHFQDKELDEIIKSNDTFLALIENALKKDGHPLEDAPKMKKSILDFLDNLSMEKQEPLLKIIKDSLRICCFCEIPNSNLMWSHYADYHKGFCIEYSTKSLFKNEIVRKFLHPVYYSNQRTNASNHIFNSLKGETNVFIGVIASILKSPEWMYEKEWRFVAPFGIANGSPSFSFCQPNRIILGTRVDPSAESTISEIAKNKHIPLINATLDHKGFDIHT